MSDELEQIQRARPRRFRPYPEYRDSGVDWLGAIPTHWDAPKMWQISRAASGGTPSKDERAYWDGEIPWVSPKDMKRRFIAWSEDRLTERAVAETGIKLVEPPVVLIVVRGMILAHSFPVAITTVPVTINQDMKAIRFASGIDPLFMVWVLEGVGKAVLAAIVEEAAHGTKAVRMDEWRSVTVPLPDVDEQRTIAAFLDRETAKIDGLVARKERLVDLLQEKRTALITRAVTQGLDPNVPMTDSGVEWLGEIPAHWEVKRLKHITSKVGSGKTPSGGAEVYASEGVMLLRSQNVHFGGLRLDDVAFIDAATDAEMAGSRVRDGDVLLNITGASLGRSCVALLDGTAANVNQHVCVVRSRTNMCNAVFLAAAIESRPLQNQIFGTENGVSRDALNFQQIGSFQVALPPTAEQRTIAAFLDRETARIDALIAKVREAIDHLEEFRTALISAAVTGKIDVREEVA